MSAGVVESVVGAHPRRRHTPTQPSQPMSMQLQRLTDEQETKLNALLGRLKRGEPVCLDNESRDELADIHAALTGGDT